MNVQVFILRRNLAGSRHGFGDAVRGQKVHRATPGTSLCILPGDESNGTERLLTLKSVETVRRGRTHVALLGSHRRPGSAGPRL